MACVCGSFVLFTPFRHCTACGMSSLFVFLHVGVVCLATCKQKVGPAGISDGFPSVVVVAGHVMECLLKTLLQNPPTECHFISIIDLKSLALDPEH